MCHFVASTPTVETFWRAIILFGRNSASYKFALAKSLLELMEAGKDFVTLEELAEPYARHLTGHLEKSSKQGTSSGSRFLAVCHQFNEGRIGTEELRQGTVRYGFNNVIDAFHIVNQAETARRFFVDERKSKGGITLTDELASVKGCVQHPNLGHEVEAHICEVCAWDLSGQEQEDLQVRIAERRGQIRQSQEVEAAGQSSLWDWESGEPCLLDGQARYGYEWFDVFSDVPKGAIFLCEKHDGYTGGPMSGYFQCDACCRVFIENYTWENYFVVLDDEILCINCARTRYMQEKMGWVTTNAEDVDTLQMTVERPEIHWESFPLVYDPETQTLYLAAVPHVLAVGQDKPIGWELIGTVMLDGMTGVDVLTSSYAVGSPIATVREILHRARERGFGRVLAILDGSYQFAVSISFYGMTKERQDEEDID